MLLLHPAALSETGRVRLRNEDRFVCDETLGLFGVADGIGGLPGGAEAAELTITRLTAALREPSRRAPDLAGILRRINQAVVQLGRQLSPLRGIGTTLTCGHLIGGALTIAHVGDSRCYLLRDGLMERLTTDHNVADDPLRRGQPGGGNPRAITRCLGQPTAPVVDLIKRQLRPGDVCLFTTDGIPGHMRETELASLLAAADDTPAAILRSMVDLALARGGHDNLTGVLIRAAPAAT